VVTQGTQIESPPKSILGGFANIEKNYNDAKSKYIDEPMAFVENSKKRVDELQIIKPNEETPKVLSSTIQQPIAAAESQPSKSITKTLPEAKISKLTSQMVENCKVITEEYNKLQESNK